jgi:hypothetical protein
MQTKPDEAFVEMHMQMNDHKKKVPQLADIVVFNNFFS